VPTRYRASSSMTARLAADSSRRAGPTAEAAVVGGGGGAARQAETRARRDCGAAAGRAPAAQPAAAGLTARKDWSEVMADCELWGGVRDACVSLRGDLNTRGCVWE